jgi:hypothetical protein
LRTARSHLTLIALLTLFVVSLAGPTRASAAGIGVTENRVEHSFAQHVTFTLEATSDAEISQVYLFFRATYDEETEKTSIPLEEPAREIRVTYTHDVRRYPLPPFADITFWWQIEDAAGNQLKTAPEQFTYTDNRFRWKMVEASGIFIHWMEGQGDPVFAQTALDIARASVKDIQAELRGPLPAPLDVFIYNSQSNLEAAMILTGRDWVGGQARPELGVVVIAVPPKQGYSSRMKRYLPHEITHLLVYELVSPQGYRNIPDWLNEGLATANEQLPTPEYALAVEEAREAGQLLSLEELCVPFSPDPRTAILSYAQSASVVRFIREEYGAEGIRRLLSAYADGASCRSGVEDALDVSFNKLENSWRVSLEPQAGWRAVTDEIGVWIGLWLLGLLLTVPMIGRIRRRPEE